MNTCCLFSCFYISFQKMQKKCQIFIRFKHKETSETECKCLTEIDFFDYFQDISCDHLTIDLRA